MGRTQRVGMLVDVVRRSRCVDEIGRRFEKTRTTVPGETTMISLLQAGPRQSHRRPPMRSPRCAMSTCAAARECGHQQRDVLVSLARAGKAISGDCVGYTTLPVWVRDPTGASGSPSRLDAREFEVFGWRGDVGRSRTSCRRLRRGQLGAWVIRVVGHRRQFWRIAQRLPCSEKPRCRIDESQGVAVKDWTEFGLRPLPVMSARSRVVEVPPIQGLIDVVRRMQCRAGGTAARITSDGKIVPDCSSERPRELR
jgi:hypothetical protein